MNHDRLEQALRDARHDFDALRTAPDAWQEQQRRLVADRSHRSRRLLGAVAAAAAVVLVVVTGAALLEGGDGPTAGPPASGQQQGGADPWATENLLGPPVTFAESQTGTGARHEGVLTDTTGEGPQLCERFRTPDGSGAAGGCSPRAENADDPGVAFDWLTGTSGGDDIAGVTVGVDDRVSSVEVWLSDGSRAAPDLLDGTWEGVRLASLVVPAKGPRPQRLVASGRDGNVLQAVDLASRFGDTWLVRTRTSCEGSATGRWPATDADGAAGVAVSWSSTDALVTATGVAPACLEPLRATALTGWTLTGDRLVVAVAPEVATVRVMAGENLLAILEPTESRGSPFEVSVSEDLAPDALLGAELVALDRLNVELDRAFVNQPATP